VLIPLSFASNIFVQPSTMPRWLEAFVGVNPLSHVATAARGLMNRTGSTGGPVAWSLTATAVIALVGAPITLRLYNRAER
jgi:ABC-2 type transport system permease protein